MSKEENRCQVHVAVCERCRIGIPRGLNLPDYLDPDETDEEELGA
jgi:hypothetical protein